MGGEGPGRAPLAKGAARKAWKRGWLLGPDRSQGSGRREPQRAQTVGRSRGAEGRWAVGSLAFILRAAGGPRGAGRAI